MTRKSHWLKETAHKPAAMGVFIENFQELGEDGLCQADPWMLEFQPGTQLDMASLMCAKLCAINNVLARRSGVAEKITGTLQQYADLGDRDAGTAILEINLASMPKAQRFFAEVGETTEQSRLREQRKMKNERRYIICNQEVRTGIPKFFYGLDFSPEILCDQGEIHRIHTLRRASWPKGVTGLQVAQYHDGEVLILELDDRQGEIAVWSSEVRSIDDARI